MTLPCILLMGPTASGKTDLAVQLVKRLPCDIISVDSAMVYRQMNIGTAKPSPELLAAAPHRLIDICDPSEIYSAGRFCQEALQEIAAIHAQGRIPLLVGGTMLYFRSLQQGLSDLPSANPKIRQQLNAEAEQLGWTALHERLAHIDPVAAQRIHPNDSQRIQRALEIYLLTHCTMTDWYTKSPSQSCPFPFIKLVISPSRPTLHARIATRFHTMLDQGLIEEVRSLLMRRDLNAHMPSMRAVGYRQVWAYLSGELAYDDLPAAGIIATRQLAKRQLIWLRVEKAAHWFDSESPNIVHQVLKYLLNNPMLVL